MANQLDIADGQFVGFSFAKNGFISITDLVSNMGMTKSEWKKWKSNYSTKVLSESEIKEIDEHFNIK